ncbi:PspC domain-containing protein [Arthrobacter sp. TE12231]
MSQRVSGFAPVLASGWVRSREDADAVMSYLPEEEAVPLAWPHCYLDWMERSLMRPRNRKILAGVCAAIAQRFGISVTLVRLGFVFFGFFGVGELVYIALWVLIPKAK